MRNQIFYILVLIANCSFSQSLDSLIEEALGNNKSIVQKTSNYNLSLARVDEQNQVAGTKISFGYFATQPQTRTGEQRAKLSLSQSFPWFGTVLEKERYGQLKSDVVYQDLVLAQRQVVQLVSLYYIDLQFNALFRSLIQEQEDLQVALKENLLNELSVSEGKASSVNLIRVEMQIQEIEQVLTNVELDRAKLQDNMALILGREEQEPIQTDALELRIGEIVDFRSEDLTVHPSVQKFSAMQEVLESEVVINKKKNRPSFSLGLDYIAVEAYDNPDLIGNGQDIFMPMLTVNIPVFGANKKSTAARIEKEMLFVKNSQDEVLTGLKMKMNNVLTSRKQAANTANMLHEKRILMERIIELELSNLETNQGSVNELIKYQLEYFEILNKEHQAFKVFYKSELDLGFLIGI